LSYSMRCGYSRFSSIRIPIETMREFNGCSFWSPMAAAILANIVFFFRAHLATSVGASGFDYAVMGLTIMVAVFGITSAIRSVGLKSYFASRKHRLDFLMNTLFAAALLAFIFLAPAVFLGVGGGVNAFVHGSSLIFELFFTIAYFWFSDSVQGLDFRKTSLTPSQDPL
jgi:hypothetical protein